ncbi:MAG: autotransporter adhesin family protein, partial [Gammaproteobacteria bacterium]|nr:autotransporter adhesin family protein [Gammaproteobacteria bacterium]
DLVAANISDALTVNSGGNIGDSGALSVGGLATLNAGGDILLDQGASTFGSLSLAASNADVTLNESMIIDGTNVTNALTLTASGSITSTDDIQAGSLTTSSNGGQTLTGAVGSFSAVNSGDGDISLTNAGDLTVSAISQTGGGSVSVGTAGSMDQTGGISADGGNVSMSASGGSITMDVGTLTNSNGGDIDYLTTGSGDITLGTLQTCPNCNAGGATGNVTVTAAGNIFGQPGQPHITAVNAVLSSAGDIGTPTNEIVFANMPVSGTVIDLIFVGKAYIDSGAFGFSASDLSAVSDAFAGTRESAASAQAAAQEDEEEVDWAAYSEDITVYEINNEGVKLPDVEEVDEFVKVEDEELSVPIASND